MYNSLGLRKLLKDLENFIKEYYKPIENMLSLRFVFECGKPAYHSKPNVERLNSNYRNFEIPKAIREKGIDEVLIFGTCFKENQYFLENPNGFVARIQLAFEVGMNQKIIDYEKSS